MSLLAGLNSAVSGLAAYGKRVGIEANNIAQAGATAAKEREAIVFDVNTNNTVQTYTPGGVGTTISQYITNVGTSVPSKVETHMALTGQGFFVTRSAPNATAEVGFTRVGTFERDRNGDFKNTSGQFLQGWPTDANGNVTVTDGITTAGLTTVSTRPLNGAPKATANITFQTQVPGGGPIGAAYNVPTQVIDALGVSHSVNFLWTKTAEVTGTSQTWNVTVSAGLSDTIDPSYAAPGMAVTFDGNGQPTLFNGSPTPPPVLNIDWASAAARSVITIDMGTINSAGVFTGGPTAAVDNFNGTKVIADGLEAGEFLSASINSATGVVSATYSNSNTVPFAKIPLAMFANANELLEGMGGVYKSNISSGSYRLTKIGENGAGGINTSNTEASKIDATEQFTKLVVDQTNYSGNLKSISTINEMFKAIFQSI